MAMPKGEGGGTGDFFRYHGLWAPGVRLFRSLPFHTKATIIALTFLLPLSVLGWNYFGSQSEQIAFSAKERQGIRYAQAVMPLLASLERQRALAAMPGAPGSAGEWATVRQAIEAQQAQLAAVQRSLGEGLGTGQAYEAFIKTAASLRAPDAAGGQDLMSRHNAHIRALLDLLSVATDGSNLTLDPDIDSYYLMDAAMFRLPVMVDAAGRLGVEGGQALHDQQASLAQVRSVVEHLTVLTEHQSAMEVGLRKAVAYNPAVASGVKAQEAFTALRQLAGLTERALLRPEGGVAGQASPHLAATRAATGAMLALAQDAGVALDDLIAARVARMERARDITALSLVVSLPLALYLFMSFRKVLDGGLREVAFHINAMRDGDLTTQPRPWGTDEAAALMLALIDMQKALRRIVTQVRGASDSIVSASTEIAGGANDLSARTEQSAANIEQTASAMEQIAATVRHNEASVMSAATLAQCNAQAAERGGEIIDEVVRTMQAINGSSGRIGDIVGTIDGIAFQTNLLALNAAVEAARAGEQGRGFAVVAGEVRALAQRASTAAREIKTLITTSVGQVEGGVRVVREAGQAIGELMDSSRRMHAMLADVAVGAREQTAGVAQTAQAVQTLDSVTQQNAALVEQTAAAAEGLKDRAHGLAGEVAQFKLP